MDPSLVVETYNFGEAQGRSELSGAIMAGLRAIAAHPDRELLVVDPSSAPGVEALLEGNPRARRVSSEADSYDTAKAHAAAAATGRFVVYIDGDCTPVNEDWVERLVAPLRAGEGIAAGGITYYPGGTVQAACSVLDFGFLLDGLESGELGCYASNNVAFDREALEAHPVPPGPLRCRCFAHAQLLERIGAPVRLVRDAVVEHAPTPFFKERLRRGSDLVGACWVDPNLPEARWLRHGVAAAPIFYYQNLRLDWRRAGRARRFFGWSPAKAAAIAVLLPIFRLVDLVGIVSALLRGPQDARGSPAHPGPPARS
jgi:hypothetical protein